MFETTNHRLLLCRAIELGTGKLWFQDLDGSVHRDYVANPSINNPFGDGLYQFLAVGESWVNITTIFQPGKSP